MSTQPQQTGRRSIDRILAPGFIDDVADLDLDELRERRHLAEQEEVDLSYARRMLQGRADLLRASQRRSVNGEPAGSRSDADLARDLAAALADNGPRTDHGLGRHLAVDPTRVGEHRRAVEQAVADLGASDPSSLDADGLARVIDQLSELEHGVSDNRRKVQHVMDTLSAEMARRYRSGDAHVEDVLAVE